ncbi:formate dehydrogenase accessory sulfurtransferase FdhD [Methanobrevibacter smithii]|uniref:formate dehydrogenase accessory sulfurtransferase FdhD n=1 Tax=Methanobrevibacter smithii TaxID=2173 RepID=UPI001FCA8199|nr:formate dehydrogenase accessory sulfurtransferase FdhD [Methanobrevibacter smithii]MBS6827069.1 formate dehydrogenase accessory sulfurtransferase FdhD [Methanobrevibacter smithii]BDF80390.1 sulfurtransferase FdhD [Methanobrevibacter smithii]BDF83019.1 sulfurtransferase FdhD [Methanobrevibacter smithii]
MKQIMEEKAQNYKNGKINYVTEKVVKDSTITLTINNEISRNLSAIEDSLEEFAVGYLFNENMVKSLEDIEKIEINENHINVEIDDKLLKTKETVLCSDSSGGWRSKIKEIKPISSDFQVEADELINRIEELKNNAQIWQATGGTHVAGIVYKNNFIVKEDVSRHVAVDKVIGYGILHDYDLSNSYVIYSGRMPADMVIKIVRAGIPVLASNAAPAYSGCETAKKGNVTLVGFLRGQRFNVYNNKNRIIF